MNMTPEEYDDVKQVYAQWSAESSGETDAVNEVYALVLKNNKKELDPKQFNEKEKRHFDEADAKEWTAWIKSGAVRVATKEEATVSPPANNTKSKHCRKLE